MIDINNITVKYKNGDNILENLSLKYNKENILCILGKNGVGKSTLLRCIMRELKPLRGTVTFNNKNIINFSQKELSKHIAYIPQYHKPTFSFNVIDVVTMGRTSSLGYFSSPSKIDYEIAQKALCSLSIECLSNLKYTELSGGERKLVMIATAIAQDAEILIFDEPTANLDFGNQFKFMNIIKALKNSGKGIIMTTHCPDHALYLDSMVAILDNRRITSYGYSKNIINSKILTELYSYPLKVENISDYYCCVPDSSRTV